MKAHVLKGTKQEIAQRVAGMSGDVREVIVFVDEPAQTEADPVNGAADVFAEMNPYTVHVTDVDDSREAIYRRMDGE